MAASDIDQKILGRIAKDVNRSNPLLSSALYQILGLSVLLSRKLYKARRARKLDTTRDTKSITLYHQIIWLSREGLAITEVLILPFCQDANQNPRCRVMAAKLRASFYHVFCLFHNYPPISQLTPPKNSPNSKTGTRPRSARDVRARQAVLRETIPSMTSDASYVTNPYAFSGPATTSPPPYPLPPIPTVQSSDPTTPMRPPALNIKSPLQRSPPSTADFIMPPLNFVPAAAAFFSQVNTLARRLLPGSDPLRLSVTFESCAFAWECAKDFALAKDRARTGVREAHAAPEAMDDNDFNDASLLVSAMKAIANRSEAGSVSRTNLSDTLKGSPPSSSPSSTTQKANSQPPSMPVSPRRPRRPRSRQSRQSQQSLSKREQKRPAVEVADAEASDSAGQSSTMANPPREMTPALTQPQIAVTSPPAAATSAAAQGESAKASPRRPRRSSRSEQSRSPADSAKSEKDRKRRILEQAEEKIRRRQAAQLSGTSTNDRLRTT